jgi:predicted phosphodiesterase
MPIARLGTAVGLLLLFAAPAQTQSPSFRFGAIGDTSYSKRGEQEFDRMIDAMNKDNLAFIVHVGDFQTDPRPYERAPDTITMPCTDENYARVLASFQRSAAPLILTPGDNDWTDCHLLKNRTVDPLDRLAKVRGMFFPEGRSLGLRTLPVQSQAQDKGFETFRENLTWTYNGVVFATVHTVGSNDNTGRTPGMDAEQAARKAANLTWIANAFAAARAPDIKGIVLVTQANVAFEAHWSASLKERYVRSAGGTTPKEAPASPFHELVSLLATEMEGFGKPALFIHGDTHLFRVNNPLPSRKSGRFFQNMTRLEVFGNPDTHWVRVTVDPADPALFKIEPMIVRENDPNR